MEKKGRSERAILIVDLINDIAEEKGQYFFKQILPVIPYVKGELQYFRERMRHVIFVNPIEDRMPHESLEHFSYRTKVIHCLSPRTGEILVTRPKPNAFFNSELDAILRKAQIGKLTIVGAFTHTSILLTTAAALEHGYDVSVPETCVASTNKKDHEAALHLISNYISNDQLSRTH